jgi:hypothetical protein
MSAGEGIFAPTREIASPALPPGDGSSLIEALEVARRAALETGRVRALHDSLAGRIEAKEALRPAWVVLPPAGAAVLSCLCTGGALIWLWRAAIPVHAAGLPSLALAANVGLLGAASVIAFRRSADRSRRPAGRLAWFAIGLVAAAGVAAFAIQAAASQGTTAFAGILGLAAAAASPWLFARLATREMQRLRSELRSVSLRLTAAEANVSNATDIARSLFEAEVLANAASKGGGSEPDRGNAAFAATGMGLALRPRPIAAMAGHRSGDAGAHPASADGDRSGTFERWEEGLE